MDWIKSKSILIAALILTNAILIFNLFDIQHVFDNKVEDQSSGWEEVLKIARSKQVTLVQEKASGVSKLQGMRLEYQMYDAEQVAQNLLGNYSVILGKYKNEIGDEMTLENGNELLYAKSIPKVNISASPFTVRSAKEKAEQFLKDIQFSSADMKYWSVEEEAAGMTIVYRQYYKDYFLDDAYMRITFTGNQISRFERKWFNPPELLDYERNIIPPAKALFLALDALNEGDEALPISIKQMELGYRLDTDTLVSSVKAGDASPYWRFLIGNGHVYYIEAQQ